MGGARPDTGTQRIRVTSGGRRAATAAEGWPPMVMSLLTSPAALRSSPVTAVHGTSMAYRG
jgi:hypothetical protein